jgi:hypothetical protein
VRRAADARRLRLDTPREPKSCSLKPISERGSSAVASSAPRISRLQWCEREATVVGYQTRTSSVSSHDTTQNTCGSGVVSSMSKSTCPVGITVPSGSARMRTGKCPS